MIAKRGGPANRPPRKPRNRDGRWTRTPALDASDWPDDLPKPPWLDLPMTPKAAKRATVAERRRVGVLARQPPPMDLNGSRSIIGALFGAAAPERDRYAVVR